jgi:hypothetical protein
MAFNPITTGSPFDGFFEEHLPKFFFEKFKGNDLIRIQSILSNLEIAFDNIYQKTKEFPDNLDIDIAEVKYLFHLGSLLGIPDIEDLSKYFDSDGNLDTALINQSQYDKLYVHQRTQIADAVAGYLLKGTKESIIRLLQSYGIITDVRELWAENIIEGPYFEYENSLITRYGSAITGSVSGDVYTEDEPIDIISEISATVPSITGIGDIEQFEMNNYGYKYLLDDNNTLYYKTSTVAEISGSTEDTWYEYDSSTLTISGDIIEFKLLNDKIYLRTDAYDLAVLDYHLDDLTITPDFSIDNNDLIFFDFIENGTYIFLDRDSKLEVRNVDDYQRLANSIDKPVSNTEDINQILLKEDKEYLIINTNKKGYILNVDTNGGTYNLNSPATVYDLLIDSDEINYKGFRIEDNSFTILKYNTSDIALTGSYFSFDDDDNMSITTPTVSIAFTEVNDYHQHLERVLVLGDTNFGIFNLKDKSIVVYNYVTTGYDYKKVFDLDLFYFLRFSGSDLDLTKITGWNSFKEFLYKTHYFDLTVGEDILDGVIDFTITTSSLRTFVEDLLLLVKPIHTELRALTTIFANYLEDSITVTNNDLLSEVPVVSGGPEFSLIMLAKYNGIHPWKRTNAQPLKYNNDGIGGNPTFKYGDTTFNFEIDTDNTDLDNLVYYNTSLP